MSHTEQPPMATLNCLQPAAIGAALCILRSSKGGISWESGPANRRDHSDGKA